MRADNDSWVARLIDWWIDEKSGYAIPERSGVLRWFVWMQDKLIWADTKEELLEAHPLSHSGSGGVEVAFEFKTESQLQVQFFGGSFHCTVG